MVNCSHGRTIPLNSAPESMSHRWFWLGAYAPPVAFRQAWAFSVLFGTQCWIIVPPHWLDTRPSGIIGSPRASAMSVSSCAKCQQLQSGSALSVRELQMSAQFVGL